MALGIIGFSVFLALSFGIAAALVSDIFFDDDNEAEAQADADPSSEFDELRGNTISASDPLGFALSLTEAEADVLLDPAQFDTVIDGATARLAAEPETEADANSTVLGTPADDVLRAADDTRFIFGDDGDDLIEGGADTDLFSGGAGNDIILGRQRPQSGGDILEGDAGNDLLAGRGGSDQLFGYEDDDVLIGGAFGDDLYGGTGVDLLYAGAGNDTLQDNFDAPPDTDRIGVEVLNAGDGDDSVRTEDGVNLVRLGAGNDRLLVLNENDSFSDDPITVVSDFEPGEDRIFLGVYGSSNDLVQGANTARLPLTLTAVNTGQGPATLVEPDLTGVASITDGSARNVGSVVLIGVAPAEIASTDVQAYLLDGDSLRLSEDSIERLFNA